MTPLRSLRHKLRAVLLLTTLAALLVSVGAIIAYDLALYRRNLVADISTQAELIGHLSAAALAFDDARRASENLSLLRLRPKVKAGALYDAHGHLSLFKRIADHGETVGMVYLRADYDMAARIADYLSVAAAVLLALLVAGLMMGRLSRVITRPILAIAKVARGVVGSGDDSRRAPTMSHDEVAQLADSFNRMLAVVEQRTGALERSNRALALEAARRGAAPQEVMPLNAQLERRVGERTLQLEASNAELERAMAAAEDANQAPSAFLSSMSHELRTPLNAILGFAQILTSDKLPSTLPQKKEFAQHILRSGRHLLALINEVLDLAKVGSGALALSLEPVALDEIPGECEAMIAPLATVRADRTRLRQILLNLLSNAVKYNRDGGALPVRCGPAAQAGWVRVVQDSGPGLGPEQLGALFQPFNRLGQEGSGIGLVVTKRLVERRGGRIGVSSRAGVGSVFWIELRSSPPPPSARPPEGARAGPAAPAGPAGAPPRTLLYVEDNPANLKLVQEIVGFRPGLRLLSVPDGRLGVALARAHLPALILMDLNLPGISAQQALLVPRDIERGLALGFAHYLTKPLNLAQFTASVDAALAAAAARRAGQGDLA